MSTLTTYMNLTAWTATTDPYSHVQLADNFRSIDAHDHSSGKGVQIPTGGLANQSVTEPKLAQPAVNTDNYYDGSITIEKLASSVFGALVPMGIVLSFWRPSGSTAVCWGDRSSGYLFELCDGRTIASSEHDFGGGSITLPNLIDKFVLYDIASALSQTGGSHDLNLSHSHIVNAHSHTVNAHSHTVNAHSHSVPQHTHAISTESAHTHTFSGGSVIYSRANAFDGGIGVLDYDTRNDVSQIERTNPNQSLYLPTEVDGQHGMDGGGSHNHGGATGSNAANSTGSSSPGTSSASPGTSSESPGTNSGLGTVDNRPAHMKLVPVVRVRNP
jgi:hypothetical protein